MLFTFYRVQKVEPHEEHQTTSGSGADNSVFGDKKNIYRPMQPVKIEIRIESEGQGGAEGGPEKLMIDDSRGWPVAVANGNEIELTTDGTADGLTVTSASALPKVCANIYKSKII